jgi:hypothetical protein
LKKALAAKALASEAGPPCRNCLYCGDERPIPVCHHLVYLNPRYDPALGRFNGGSNRLTTSAREDAGYCGPEALLFEPKTLTVRVGQVLSGNRAVSIFSAVGFIGFVIASPWIF